MTASAAAARLQAIQQLRGQLRATSAPVAARNVCPTGLTTLDQLLPDGGIPSGSVVEWLSRGPGQSATSLALRAASGLLLLANLAVPAAWGVLWLLRRP